MRTRKSAPMLTEGQRRRQIIDLLAGHLARMPEAVAVSSPREVETGPGQSCQGVTAASLKVSRFRGSASASDAATIGPAEKLSEFGQTRLDVSAEMPLSVSTSGGGEHRENEWKGR